jgi:hypothetical protein
MSNVFFFGYFLINLCHGMPDTTKLVPMTGFKYRWGAALFVLFHLKSQTLINQVFGHSYLFNMVH